MRGAAAFVRGVPRRLTALAPRRPALVAAFLAVAWAVGYSFAQETPVGRLHGRVRMAESLRPLSGVRVAIVPISTDGESDGVRRAISDVAGRFVVPRLPSGTYYVQAATHAHSVQDAFVSVDEGETTDLDLALERSAPELAMGEHPRVFAPTEPVSLPVRGYVDADRPQGRDMLHLRVYRTRLSVLRRQEQSFREFEHLTEYGGGNSGSALPPSLLAHALRCEDQEVPIREADLEGFYNKRVRVATGKPGVYLVEMTHGQQSVSSWVLVTSAALVTKLGRDRTVAWVVGIADGRPLSGYRVDTCRGGLVVASGVTDGAGLCSLSAGQPGDSQRTYTIASKGDDEAVVDLGEGYSREGHGRYVVHTYTDRPIYRPGQRVYFNGIARQTAGRAGAYTVPGGQPVEMEVRTPDDERLARLRTTCDSFGSFHGQVDLSAEAPSGSYGLVARIAGEEHSSEITVASYRKPEFTVTVTPGKPRYTDGDEVTMTVSAQYYFGSPVVGASLKYYVMHEIAWAEEYADSDDTDDSERHAGDYAESYGELQRDGEATLDENGKATIRFRAKGGDSPDGPQASDFTLSATVTDASGREMTAEGRTLVTAGTLHLSVEPDGYVAEPGKPMAVTVVVRDYDGKPAAGVRVDLATDYSWYDEAAEERRHRAAGAQSGVTDRDGRAVMQVTAGGAGELRLMASARDSHGRAVHGRAYVWAAGDGGGNLEGQYTDLAVATDKRRYRPGETARVLVSAARTGQTVLLTVEGDHLYRTFTVPMTQRSIVQYVPVLAEYGPNVYLSVCYVRNKRFAQSSTPLRVSVPDQEIQIAIRPDRPPATGGLPRYHPGDRVRYAVTTSDAAGRPVPAEVSFGVVDESIYALAEDDPRALRNAFYPHRSNSIDTSCSLTPDYLGATDKGEPSIEARRRFLDTAFWQPDLRTDASGHASVSFKLPDNLTTWRATAIGHTMQTALGRQTSKVVCSKDLMVRIEMPRFVTQHDATRLQALVNNETGQPQAAYVRLRADGLRPSGDLVQEVHIAPGQGAQVSWPVTAERVGEARVTVSTWTAPAAGRPQYTDAVEMPLIVRPHGRLQTQAFSGDLAAARPEEEVFRLDQRAIPTETRLTVRITPSVATAIAGALEYLVGYPYGCTEQTLSRFVPDLLVQRLARVGGGAALADGLLADLPRMVRDGLTRLYRLQHATGGWGWWENDPDSAWMTAYALYGLATARAQGYDVAPKVLRKGLSAARNLVGAAKPADTPFLLYALALAGDGKAAKAGLSKLDLSKLDSSALAYVVVAARVVGADTGPAMRLLDSRAVVLDGMLHWQWGSGWDNDDLTATAVGLRAMLATDAAEERVLAVLRWLMMKRAGGYWSSTRDTAAVLAALCDYLSSRPSARGAGGQVRVRVNGKDAYTFDLGPENRTERQLVWRAPLSSIQPGKNTVQLLHLGGASGVFYSVELRQVAEMEDMPPLPAAGLRIQREYLRVVPKRSGDEWVTAVEPTGNQLRPGDRVRVRLTLTTPRDVAYVLVEDPFPAGCEVTERGSADEADEWSFWWSGVDVRDDRIAFFARVVPAGRHVIEYNLRAQTPGSYHALPAVMQAMYAPDIRAESDESRVEVH